MNDKRYKQRGLNFKSAEDSRALRAIENRVGRKAQRDALLSHRRLDTLDTSKLKSAKTDTKRRSKRTLADVSNATSKKNDRECQLQRYEELLKWREERRKKLDVEKRQRKPSFKTGVFQPDAAKFLVSEDGKVLNSSSITTPAKTPFKYLKRSSSKYGFTPGASTKKVPRFCTGVTPSTTTTGRLLKFNTRTTPLVKSDELQKNVDDQKENLAATQKSSKNDKRYKLRGRTAHKSDMKRILRGRSSRLHQVLDDHKDLGVEALPVTPPTTRSKRSRQSEMEATMESQEPTFSQEVSSFAPENFTFDFKATVKEDLPSHSEVIAMQRRMSQVDDGHKSEDAAPPSHKPLIEDSFDTTEPMDINSHTEEMHEETEADELAKASTIFSHANEALQHSIRMDSNSVYSEAQEKGHEIDDVEDEGPGQFEREAADKTVPEVLQENKDKYRNEVEGWEAECRITSDAEEKVEDEISDEVEDGITNQEDEITTGLPTEVNRINNVEGTEKVEEITNEVPEDDHGKMFTRIAAREVANDEKPETEEKMEVETEVEEERDKISDGLHVELNVSQEHNEDSLHVDVGNMSHINMTPLSVQRRSTRRSVRISGRLDIALTPVMKLRPRTPCSRSTRRSMSAHCDFMPDQLMTPRSQASSRRSTRRSTAKKSRISSVKDIVIPLDFEEHTEDIANVQVEAPSSDRLEDENVIREEEEDSEAAKHENDASQEAQHLKTPIDNHMVTPSVSGSKSNISWLLESPFVTTKRGSGKSKKKRGDVPPSNLLHDGSPLPSHLTPLLNKCQIDEDQSPLLPAAPVSFPSMDDVPMSPEEQTCSNLLELLKPSTPPARNDTPDIDVWGEENNEDPNDSLAPLASTNTSLLQPIRASPLATRRSTRISLLPGLSATPTSAKLSVATGDLISWETPMTSAKSSKIPIATPMSSAKKSSKIPVAKGIANATPCRRSRRLSKAYFVE